MSLPLPPINVPNPTQTQNVASSATSGGGPTQINFAPVPQAHEWAIGPTSVTKLVDYLPIIVLGVGAVALGVYLFRKR